MAGTLGTSSHDSHLWKHHVQEPDVILGLKPWQLRLRWHTHKIRYTMFKVHSVSIRSLWERERERSSHWRSLVRYWGKAGADRTSVDVVHNMQLRELCTKWSQHYLHPCPEVFQENSQCWLVFRIIALAFQWSERYNASAGTVDVFAILLFRDVRVHFGPWLVMQIVEIG